MKLYHESRQLDPELESLASEKALQELELSAADLGQLAQEWESLRAVWSAWKPSRITPPSSVSSSTYTSAGSVEALV